jgi:hypothetical protein
MVPVRPDYKSHPLWTEAMELAKAAYAVAEEVAGRAPEEARLLRKAAVTVPARLAEALSAEDSTAESPDAFEVRAALDEVATRAGRLPTREGSARDLARRARDLERSVVRELGASEGYVC